MTVVIIGAGASGLSCAIKLKQNNAKARVIILERLQTPGKKILATGNGRCNITNRYAENYNETATFFSSIGLMLREDDGGRIYPYSQKAETALEILLKACHNLGVEIITDCRVTDIEKLKSGFCVKAEDGEFRADSVVVCTGGRAQGSLGSDGSGYELLKGVGHSVTALSPALVQLTSSSKYPRAIKGTRTKCTVKIELDGRTANEEYGEVLFTDYGLSGIAIMNLSHTVSESFSKQSPARCVAVLDLIPEMSVNEIYSFVKRFGSLTGILGTKLSDILEKQSSGDAMRTAEFAKSWRLIITGTKGYDFAQITSGGIPIDEVSENFESLKVKNLYICGEVLDKQYPCGGFNLDFAWHSGIKAANEITNKM